MLQVWVNSPILSTSIPITNADHYYQEPLLHGSVPLGSAEKEEECGVMHVHSA